MKLVFSMHVLYVYLFLVPENFFLLGVGRVCVCVCVGGGGGGAQVQHQLQQWAKYWYSIVWDVLTQSI